jgi:hypothetical protein
MFGHLEISPSADERGNVNDFRNRIMDPLLASMRASASLNNPNLPTNFSRPFRDGLGSDLAPPLRSPAGPALRNSGVDAGVLRRSEGLNGGSTRPLYVRPTSLNPLDADRQRDRNPFARYETLMRMPNLVTNQANIYVMRLTMGYFEVDPTTLGVGREYGADEGKAKRYQGLYIIDRTVPVAYERGKDHNVRNTILFQQVYAR